MTFIEYTIFKLVKKFEHVIVIWNSLQCTVRVLKKIERNVPRGNERLRTIVLNTLTYKEPKHTL